MPFTFSIPTNFVFGAGSVQKLHKQRLPGKKALIVISSGKSTRANGYLDTVQDQLTQAGVEYAVFDLSAEEEAGLAPGDYLLLPEMSAEKPGRMCRPGTAPADRLRIVAAEQTNVPFATALQDDLRCAPVGTDDLVLMRGNRRIASGRLSKLGEQPAFAVEALC